MADKFARGGIDDVVDNVFADDTVLELLYDLVRAGAAERFYPHTLRTAALRAIFVANDYVLRNVHKTSGKITGVCRFKSGIRKTFTSAV